MTIIFFFKKKELWLFRRYVRENNFAVDTGEIQDDEGEDRPGGDGLGMKATHFWDRQTSSLQRSS